MSRPTILVIEDNALDVGLVTEVLEASGFDVLHAADAEEGLFLARSEAPALVLIDIALPGGPSRRTRRRGTSRSPS